MKDKYSFEMHKKTLPPLKYYQQHLTIMEYRKNGFLNILI